MNNHLMPNIWVRLTEQQLKDLDYIATELPGRRSDHARQAIKEYNARTLATLRTLAHPPVADPAATDPAGEDVVLREVGQ